MFQRAQKTRHASTYLPNNDVKLIDGGAPYFELLEKMIRSAQYVVHFQVYIFEEDETGTRIAKALKEAALRKVKVYLLVDGYASKALSREFIQDLKDAGINFRPFEPLLQSKKFYFGRRLHHKVVVVDSFYCLIAGLNISDRYNDTPKARAWLDWALFAEGEIAPALEKICVNRYKLRIRAKHEAVHPAPLKISALKKNSHVRVRINDWVDRKREISRTYLEMFGTAKSHITLMSPYFLPGYEFRRRMKQAVRRGVTIKVVLAGISDIALSKYAERYMYRWMLKNNVEIYEYQKTVLHGKMAVCDDQWMTVGSYNLNNLSAYASVELNFDVKDPEFAKTINRRLQTIIDTDCQRITLKKYDKKTGWVEHVAQKLAYYLLRVILFLFTFYFRQKE